MSNHSRSNQTAPEISLIRLCSICHLLAINSNESPDRTIGLVQIQMDWSRLRNEGLHNGTGCHIRIFIRNMHLPHWLVVLGLTAL